MKHVEEYTDANRAAWDASAEAHRKTDDWQEIVQSVARLDFLVLDPTITDALREIDIAGARAVQIGCSNGRELLSLPALGAVPVLGIDQSEAFLAQARELAGLAGSKCDFVSSDIYALPPSVPQDFDLALITIGVLGWLPDLPRFLEIVAGLLAPGGRLVIYETHPILDMYEPESDDPFTPIRSYFDRTPQSWAETITYDGSDGEPGPESFWFTHTMGEIVTQCVSAGMRLVRLTEYGHSNREVEFDIYERRTAQLPMCYILVAEKP